MFTAHPGYWVKGEDGGGGVEERAQLRAAGSPWAGVKVEPTGRGGEGAWNLGCPPEFQVGRLSGQMVVPSTKMKTVKEGKHRVAGVPSGPY